MMQHHSVDGFVFHSPRSAKLSAATTVNHAARRGHILTQSSACLSSEYKTNRVRVINDQPAKPRWFLIQRGNAEQ